MIKLRRKAKATAGSNGHIASAPLVLSGPDNSTLLGLPSEVTANLRSTINRIMRDRNIRDGGFPRRLALVASLRGEGVTFLSRALGALIANDYGSAVCVVELNWWWPAPDLSLAQDQPTVVDLAMGRASVADLSSFRGAGSLSIVPAGDLAPHLRAVMARSEGLARTVDLLSERYDHLILDVPALLATADAIPLASLGDSCSLVVRQGVTSIEHATQALDEIKHLIVVGAILNQAKLATPGWIQRLVPQR